jgi:hypothetical protein
MRLTTPADRNRGPARRWPTLAAVTHGTGTAADRLRAAADQAARMVAAGEVDRAGAVAAGWLAARAAGIGSARALAALAAAFTRAGGSS